MSVAASAAGARLVAQLRSGPSHDAFMQQLEGLTVRKDDLSWLQESSASAGGTPRVTQSIEALDARASEKRHTYNALSAAVHTKSQHLRSLEQEEAHLRSLVRNMELSCSVDGTPAERKHRDELADRVEEMELLMIEQQKYVHTLGLMRERERSRNALMDSEIDEVRKQISDLVRHEAGVSHARREAQSSALRARRTRAMARQVAAGESRVRSALKEKRERLLRRADISIDEEKSMLKEEAEAVQLSQQETIAVGDIVEAVRKSQVDRASTRAAAMAAMFDRVQTVMGLLSLDDVVVCCHDQRAAHEEMLAIREVASERLENLTAAKRRVEAMYEEQLGGVDAELTERRREYDSLVLSEAQVGADPLERTRAHLLQLLGRHAHAHFPMRCRRRTRETARSAVASTRCAGSSHTSTCPSSSCARSSPPRARSRPRTTASSSTGQSRLRISAQRLPTTRPTSAARAARAGGGRRLSARSARRPRRRRAATSTSLSRCGGAARPSSLA